MVMLTAVAFFFPENNPTDEAVQEASYQAYGGACDCAIAELEPGPPGWGNCSGPH